MKMHTYLLVILTSITPLKAAAPIAHIVFALSVLHLLPPTIDKQAFIVGTSFPDIRYPAQIKRSKTHLKPATWHDVINEPSSFKAGMIFHNLVDNIRLEHFELLFYTRKQPHNTIYHSFFPFTLKVAEDYLLYKKINNWSTIIRFFDTTYPEEEEFVADKHIIKSWHKMLQSYLKQQPSAESIKTLLSKENLKKLKHGKKQFDMQKKFEQLIQCNEFTDKLHCFYDNFAQYAGIK